MHETTLERAITLAIFAASYVGLGLGRLPGLRVDRTGVAIIGGTLMVLSGVLPWNDAVLAVDARTPRSLLAAVIAAAGVLSALFVNDVVCLVLSPLVVGMTRRLALPPVPYLVALATAANVGSVATLTGNPQNMLVGSFSTLTYREFLVREGPIALLGLVSVFIVVWFVYRRELPEALTISEVKDRVSVHYPLMVKTVAAVGVMLIAFLAGAPIALVAIGGAAY